MHACKPVLVANKQGTAPTLTSTNITNCFCSCTCHGFSLAWLLRRRSEHLPILHDRQWRDATINASRIYLVLCHRILLCMNKFYSELQRRDYLQYYISILRKAHINHGLHIRGNQHHAKHSCQWNASNWVAGEIPHIPTSAYIAAKAAVNDPLWRASDRHQSYLYN
eukprot:1995411-Pleurochrysis_carterae.AAC.2